ncbi:hypothetical protein SIID45300_02225 [Candidatus Magnetaquicoccaceae bacterium FCR-1]|uniref:DUF2202 domain-containing protein n=1 Tax=Candidatus Magnetaquiglobus chichijimensis TaxID=3141448 RepID=A0ABQ0CAI6_9PROT
MAQNHASFSATSCTRCHRKPKNPDEECIEACTTPDDKTPLQKNLLFWLLGTAGLAIVLIVLAIYQSSSVSPPNSPSQNNANQAFPAAYATPVAKQIAIGPLTPQEARSILFMREEEKLARDVYQEMHRLWGLSMFVSISRAEQRHMDAVGQLIQRYGLADPAEQNRHGFFVDPHLSQLYQQLMQQGQRSVIDALRVGALIEEVDILDLENAIKETSKQDIIQVYSLIQRGSFNHLRAFAHGLELQGIAYAPVKLSAQSFDTILHSPMNTGLFGNP